MQSTVQQTENIEQEETCQTIEETQFERMDGEQTVDEYEEEIDVRIETQETEEVYVEVDSAEETEEVIQKGKIVCVYF